MFHVQQTMVLYTMIQLQQIYHTTAGALPLLCLWHATDSQDGLMLSQIFHYL
jgi:hypothetical protein